jgi:competence protein ComEA
MKSIKTVMSAVIATLILCQLSTASAADSAPEAISGLVVNINEATSEQLEALPNIGPSKAQAIVDYRAKRPFKKVEDLMRVKGIGRKTFNKLRPYLAVKGQTTVPTAKKPAK